VHRLSRYRYQCTTVCAPGGIDDIPASVWGEGGGVDLLWCFICDELYAAPKLRDNCFALTLLSHERICSLKSFLETKESSQLFYFTTVSHVVFVTMSDNVSDLDTILPKEQDDLTYFQAQLETGAREDETGSIVSLKLQSCKDTSSGTS
jgi:hypothetical protein